MLQAIESAAQEIRDLSLSQGSSKATSHLKLALIESQDLDKARQWQLPPNHYSNRASSITPASKSFLTHIGAWNHVDVSRIQPYHHMRIWDGFSPRGRISFDSPEPDPPIAQMTENQNLTRALVERIDELDAVSLFNKASVSEIHLGPSAPAAAPDPPTLNLSSYPHVMLASNQTIAARLLVGADGPNGPVRKFAGLQTRGWDYNRHGVVATLKLGGETYHNPENAIGVTAYQRFLPTGPIALLALPGQYASLVWTTTATRAAHLKSLSQEDFLAMVKAAFRLSTVDLDYMSNISSGQAAEYSWRESVNPSTTAESNREIPAPAISVQEGSIASFPLRLRQATSYTTHRIALIGDAAHTIHPLAGQGLNMGLADAQSLASAIETAVVHGADIGAQIECLDQYNADMWMKNNRMLGAVDKLHWLYSVGSGPLVGLRSLGLKAVDSFGPAKEFFMRQAGAV